MNDGLMTEVQTLIQTLSAEERTHFMIEIEKIQNDAQALEVWLRTEQQAILKKNILLAHNPAIK